MIKSLRALAVASITLALSVPIAAQGIPDRVEVLEGAVQTLQTNVKTLQADVQTLQATNSTLQSQITGLQGQVSGLQSRVVVLESSNTALQSKVGTIQNQVGGLQNQQMVLDAKVTGLQNQGQVYIYRSPPLNFELHEGSFSLVGALDLPAGSYLIHTIVPVLNNSSQDDSGECFLSTVPNGGGFGMNPPGVAGDAVMRISGRGFAGQDHWYAQIPLFDVATFTSTTRVQLYCAGDSWQVRPTILAVSIGNILSQ
jgi:chaperonin cofactor prefoldin